MKESEFLQSLPPLPSPPPPPPPPLPPICLPKLDRKVNPFKLCQDQVTGVEEGELEVAIQSLLSSEKSLRGVFYLKNSFLKPQLQCGPKCGLVALSIATSITENFVNVEDIFKLALAHGFTKQGEIFDASALAVLAEKWGFKAQVLDGGLSSHLSCILKSLLNKCLLLVPYDADFNHAPCCKEGSRAHWAVISGVVIMEENSENGKDGNIVVINSPKCDGSKDEQLHLFNHQGQIVIGNMKKNIEKTVKKGKVYLIGLQGKSKHIGLWSFDDMALSNDNLIYFPPTRNPEMYVVPEGGVLKGLRGRAVLLEYSGMSLSTSK